MKLEYKYHKKVLRGLKWSTLLVIFLFASCSQTRFVAEDDYLLRKVKLEVDNPEIDKDEAKSFIRQKENYKILGFIKFYLMLYNMSSKKKDNDWFKRIGEAPQLYDEVMVDRSIDQLKQYMHLKGYYRAKIGKNVIFNEKKKKAELKFTIKTGEQYSIKSINYHFANKELERLFYNSSVSRFQKAGNPFDYYELEKLQKKIAELYNNNGYYYFTKNQVKGKADTSLYDKQAVLDIFIGEMKKHTADSVKILKPFYFNRFQYLILPEKKQLTSTNTSIPSDTIQWNKSSLYLTPNAKYPPKLFERINQMKSGNIYQASEVENTFNGFNRLHQFRFVDIKFSEAYPLQDSNLLNCSIRLAPLKKQSTSFDIEGTNTSGNLGVAGNIYHQHRNLFKGAEVFQLRLKGAVERLSRKVDNRSQYFITKEFGIESNLTIPKLLGPGKFINSFKKHLPKTVLTTGFNYQLRPEYTRTITNLTFGYDWKKTQHLRNTWNILDLNYVKLSQFDPSFIERIKDLYVKSSFTDHLILGMNYSIVYNNQVLNSTKNYTYGKLNIESAGNALWSLSKLIGKRKTNTTTFGKQNISSYQMLNTVFAQYIKADVEVRRALLIDKYNSIVGRAFVGVGLPYGNSGVMPFEKQYFSGGANGIRAWQVRSLGPGTYKAPEGSYPNQSGDIKLEANVEYRFRLLGAMEGAFFFDAGNIWAITQNDNREGALFQFNNFYKQFAVGTGTGFRFDLSYFILRVDIGMKLHDPTEKKGSRWIIGNRSLNFNDFAFSYVIGYPF